MTPQKSLRVLGWKIRNIRLLRDWSQAEVAKRARLKRRYFDTVERGRANLTVATLLRVAMALGVAPRALL